MEIEFNDIMQYVSAGVAMGFVWATTFDIVRHVIKFIADLLRKS